MIRIGVLCPSEIAQRRFMPAVMKNDHFCYVGVGVCTSEERAGTFVDEQEKKMAVERQYQKGVEFSKEYDGRIFEGYGQLLASEDVDAVYIPLPPALHYKWAKMALENGKHVLLEKPFATSYEETAELIALAKERNLAIHENYMFAFHKQIKEVSSYIEQGNIGKVRLYRIAFGFPRRAKNDFRYNPQLGGGALLDCGGYTVKYADMLLKNKAELLYANMYHGDEEAVDIFGTAAFTDAAGTVVQTAYGMDNDYKCEIEAWGSTGTLKSSRILTAPAGFTPCMEIIRNNKSETVLLSEDDSFANSIQYFAQCIENDAERKSGYQNICRQAELMEQMENSIKSRGNV